jgi:uncharacterized membrane protein
VRRDAQFAVVPPRNRVESFLESILYLGFAVVIIGLKVTILQLGLVLLILVLTFLSFLSLGMISAAFIMVFKQGNPINWCNISTNVGEKAYEDHRFSC